MVYAVGVEFAKYREKLINYLNDLELNKWDEAANLLIKTWLNEATVYVIGNGGSAATANHFATDWVKGINTIKENFKAKTISFASNIPLVTAISNDLGYNESFVYQLKQFMKAEDCLVAISGSGNSENIIKSVDFATEIGASVITLIGFNGGKLKKKGTVEIHVKVDDMQFVEDIHSIFGHFVLKKLINE